MSQTTTPMLAIPGPIELSPAVKAALAEPPLSHVSPAFVKIFQESLKMTRVVVGTAPLPAACPVPGHTSSSSAPKGHPESSPSQVFLLTGSGTLGWDQVGANLIQQGDTVLVVSTGYFGTGFRECLEAYGATVDTLKAALGHTVPLADIEKALKARKYKMVTITHVDTSTGVLSDAKAIAECVRKVSPNSLVALDAVCSLASEEVRMDAWGLDVVLSASQKGLGGPPGLSVVAVSARAMKAYEEKRNKNLARKGGFYSSWEKWLPIMKAYESGSPAYFGTPAVNVVRAYHASLLELTQGSPNLSERVRMHRAASDRIKAAGEALGLKQVAREPAGQAHGMTALYVPEGMKVADVLGAVGRRGVVMAGGLVAEIKDRYLRVGHMGYSVVGKGGKDVDRMIRVLEESVREVRSAMLKNKEMEDGARVTARL